MASTAHSFSPELLAAARRASDYWAQRLLAEAGAGAPPPQPLRTSDEGDDDEAPSQDVPARAA